MRKLNLLLPFLALLGVILGCGGKESKPKEWHKAKPITDWLDHPNALVTDGQSIYFVTGGTIASRNEGTNNVMKMPLGGAGEVAAPVVIFKGGEMIPNTDAIAVDDKYIYFSANGLRRMAKEGGEARLLTQAFMPSEIVLDNENIYWKPFVGEGMPPAPFYSVSKNGGEPKTLTDPRPSGNGLCVDENFIYWTQTDGIYKMPKKGGNIEKIYSTLTGEISSGLKNDAENLYFLQGESNRNLMKMPKSGGEAKQLAKNVSKFWLGEDAVVFQRFITSFGIALYKVGKDGAGEIELDRDGHVSDLIVGKNKIYLSDIIKIYELDK
jgi:hypothetical protein